MIRRFARPYARAIIDVLGSPEKANVVRKELVTYSAALAGASDLRDLYANPGIDNDAKLKITHTIVKRLGLSDMALRILEVLIANHRINDLAAINEAVASMVNEALGVVVADVRSAHTLSEAEIADLQKTLQRKVGKDVEIHLVTDPALLGGFVAKIGSEIYDASVSGKIQKFRTSLV
ncbi:MAG: ATP synthase F1 subunit delta [Acidobacteriota bacterium]